MLTNENLTTPLLTEDREKFAQNYCIHDYRDDWVCRICGYILPTRLRVLIHVVCQDSLE
jgi:rubrerythrin